MDPLPVLEGELSLSVAFELCKVTSLTA